MLVSCLGDFLTNSRINAVTTGCSLVEECDESQHGTAAGGLAARR